MTVPLQPKEVFELLLQRAMNAIERPRMYAPGPDCLETYLSLLDEFMCVIVGADRMHYGLSAFLSEHEYGSASICSRARIDGESLADDELTTRIITVWHEYRTSKYVPTWSAAE